MRLVVLLSFIAVGVPTVVAAQAPAGAPPAAAAPAVAVTAVTPAAAPTAIEHYAYQVEGRRDPFLSLTANTADSRTPITRAEGIAGLSVTDLSVRGVMQSRGSLIAMVQGPDRRAYVVHQGDKFADGTVKAITVEGLVIVQQVNDPLSLVKQREVRKLLRSVEDGKQ